MTAAAPAVREILDLCDRQLGEPGRRDHVFTWLRAPGGAAEDWLPVDAYYPAHRLVVVCGEPDPLYSELVPAHGLRLLALRSEAIADDPGSALRTMIAELEPVAAPAPLPEARPRPAARPAGYGVGLGLALAVALFIELYLGVARGALDHGHIALAFGLALDACARAVGAVAARRAGSPDWAWGSVLIGSPLILAVSRSDQATAEPAPLAGLLALVALIAFAVALLTG